MWLYFNFRVNRHLFFYTYLPAKSLTSSIIDVVEMCTPPSASPRGGSRRTNKISSVAVVPRIGVILKAQYHLPDHIAIYEPTM